MIDTLDAQICVLDAKGQIVEVNQQWIAFASETGVTRSAERGPSFLDCCQASSAYGGKSGSHEVSSAVIAMLSGKQLSFKKEVSPILGGEECLLSIRLSAMPVGSLGSIVVVQKDCTEHRQHERRLREARSQAETLAGALKTSR